MSRAYTDGLSKISLSPEFLLWLSGQLATYPYPLVDAIASRVSAFSAFSAHRHLRDTN
jgi:hypothetical protein